MRKIHMERSGEMEVFAQVVENGGFSAGARSLGRTPSAVSKLIARLEDRLGARLFARSTRALTLTEEGESYYRAAQRILRDLDEADHTVAGGDVRGRLSVSSSVPFGRMFVTPAISSFLALHPGVIVDLSLTDHVIDLIAQRTDVAIRVGNLAESGLIARKLGQSRMVVCAAPSYLKARGAPRTPEDLDAHECLKFNFQRSFADWPFLQAERETRRVVPGNLYVNNGDTMRELAIAGAGIARLAAFHVAAELKVGTLVPLLEKFNVGDLEVMHAVYVGSGKVARRVRAFIDHLAQSLKTRSLELAPRTANT